MGKLCPECYKRGWREGKSGKGDWDSYRPPLGKDSSRCPNHSESLDHLTAYEDGFWDGAANRQPKYN